MQIVLPLPSALEYQQWNMLIRASIVEQHFNDANCLRSSLEKMASIIHLAGKLEDL